MYKEASSNFTVNFHVHPDSMMTMHSTLQILQEKQIDMEQKAPKSQETVIFYTSDPGRTFLDTSFNYSSVDTRLKRPSRLAQPEEWWRAILTKFTIRQSVHLLVSNRP